MPSERLNYHTQRLKPSPFHGAAQAGAREGQETGSLLLELQQRIEDRRKAIELVKNLKDTWFIYYVMKIKTDCWCVIWYHPGKSWAGSNVSMARVAELLAGNGGQG